MTFQGFFVIIGPTRGQGGKDMYTEDKKGFPIGNLLTKLILVIIFVLLLVWLLPKFMVPAITKSINNGKCGSNVTENTAIKALTSQIFSDNLEKMKKAAISYYTDERLPKEVNESKKLTLSDMIGLKIIVPLIDKNNKAVDVEKSYVKITKTSDDYILKVNIKDSEKEDYILVHLGCYTYCNSNICEKKTEDVPLKAGKDTTITPGKPVVPTITPKCATYNGKYYDIAGKVVSYEDYKKSCIPEEKHVCVKYDGKYYNKDGKVVSYEDYKKSCGQEEKHICVKYDGKYYDKNGKVVSYEDYKKACMPEDTHICVKYNGKYYDNNGKVVSYEEYKKACLPEEKHICVKYNGKYYDINGNVVSYEEYKKSCESKKEYLYEYTKTIEAKFSEWTKWTDWAKTSCSTQEINCYDNDPTCLKKLQMYTNKEQIGTYDKAYIKTREVIRQTGAYQEKACSKYNYVVINNTTYATTTTTKYTQTNVITSTTRTSIGGWEYIGRQSFSTRPSDTATTHYKFAGADFSYCTDTCTTLPTFYYDVYKYTGGLTTVLNTKSTPSKTVSTSTSETTTTTTTEVDASCGEYVTKTIPIYSTITVTEKATRTEPLYGDVCYQSTKTRNLISDRVIKLKWSKYNDTSLLNDGWTYTGNRKEK